MDPLNPHAIINRAIASALEEKKEEVEDYVEKNLRINPSFLNTYFYYALIKMYSPFGQMDEAIKNLDIAYSKDQNQVLALSFMPWLYLHLEEQVIGEYYYGVLKERFGNHGLYRETVMRYSFFSGDVTDYERDVLEFYEQSGVQHSFESEFIGLYGYGLATGNIGRVVPFYQKSDPDLFEANLSMPSKASIDKAFQLAVLLTRSGDIAQAEVLTRAVCRFAEASPQWLIHGAEDVEYLKYQSYCALLEGNYAQLEQLLRQRFEDRGDILYVSQELLVLERYIPQAYTPAIRGLHEQVRAELGRQRENVHTYLKTNNRWNPAWDATE